jgi:hypothetical protein
MPEPSQASIDFDASRAIERDAPGARASMTARRDRAATAVAGAIVIASLALRAVVRGPYYPGWDIMLAVTGAFCAATKPLRDTLRLAFDTHPQSHLSVSSYSVFGALIPGYLDSLYPWEYWPHLVALILVAATFWLIAIALELPWRRRWIVLLAWAASPPLLSFALVGFPWGTAFLPHAVAMVAILKPSVRRSWLLTPLLCLVATVVAWQGYDLGKTVFVAFLAGAILVRNVPLLTRLVWLAVGAFQVWAVVTHQSGPTHAFIGTRPDGIWPILAALGTVGRSLVTRHGVDLPFLLVAAALGLCCVRRDRLFLATQLAVQLGLVVLLTMSAQSELRPRRFLAVGYCAVVIVGAAFRADSPLRGRRAIVAVLVAGVIAQIGSFVAFASWPRPAVDFPLPYTHSEADYMVVRPPIDWATRMSEDVLAGDTLVVVYGRFAYDENATNPTAVLERVYLHVGHDRFVRQVHVFGSLPCGFSCLPLRPLSEIEHGVAQVASNAAVSSRPVHLYYSQDFHLTYEHTFETESALVFAAVRRHFALRDELVLGPKLLHFRLVPRPAGASGGITMARAGGDLVGATSPVEERVRVTWNRLPFEHYWVVDQPRPPRSAYVDARPWPGALRVQLSGTMTIARSGRYELILGAEEPAELRLDGEKLLSTPGGGIRIDQASRPLAPGDHDVQVAYDDAQGTAHLLVDVYREGDGDPAAPAP